MSPIPVWCAQAACGPGCDRVRAEASWEHPHAPGRRDQSTSERVSIARDRVWHVASTPEGARRPVLRVRLQGRQRVRACASGSRRRRVESSVRRDGSRPAWGVDQARLGRVACEVLWDLLVRRLWVDARRSARRAGLGSGRRRARRAWAPTVHGASGSVRHRGRRRCVREWTGRVNGRHRVRLREWWYRHGWVRVGRRPPGFVVQRDRPRVPASKIPARRKRARGWARASGRVTGSRDWACAVRDRRQARRRRAGPATQRRGAVRVVRVLPRWAECRRRRATVCPRRGWKPDSVGRRAPVTRGPERPARDRQLWGPEAHCGRRRGRDLVVQAGRHWGWRQVCVATIRAARASGVVPRAGRLGDTRSG